MRCPRCEPDYWRYLQLGCLLLPAVLVVSCGGKQTGDEGDASEYQPTEVVENTPDAPAPPEEEPPEGGGGSTPTSNAGPLDACEASTWTNPDEPRTEAGCSQVWDESGDEPQLRYVCSCDLDACPIYGDPIDDGDPSTPVEVTLNDCVVEATATDCGASLEEVCGVSRGQHGYCDRSYYKPTQTRPGQDTPDAFTVVCFEDDNGGHACQCPDVEELVRTEETDCNLALLRACQVPCESSAGQCEPTESGYDCACTAGFARSVVGGLCDYALFASCEPACTNEAGGCYWDPTGGPEIICLCNGEGEPQSMVRDPDVDGDECRTPLVETCGGTAE